MATNLKVPLSVLATQNFMQAFGKLCRMRLLNPHDIYALAKCSSVIDAELKVYQSACQNLFKQYGKEVAPGKFQFPPDKMAEVPDKLAEFQKLEIELPLVGKITVSPDATTESGETFTAMDIRLLSDTIAIFTEPKISPQNTPTS